MIAFCHCAWTAGGIMRPPDFSAGFGGTGPGFGPDLGPGFGSDFGPGFDPGFGLDLDMGLRGGRMVFRCE